MPYADDENVIRGERILVIRPDTGKYHGELARNVSFGWDAIGREEDSIIKMSESDGTPKGLRRAFHINRAHARIAATTENMNRLDFAAARLKAGPAEPG